MQHSNMYFNVLSIFPSQWVVKSSSCLKWSSKIKARMVSWIKMWHMFLEVQVHVISCRIRVLIRLRLCSPSVETACEHLLQHIMQILIFSIKSSTSRSIVSQCVWKKFYFICLVIVFHCPFLRFTNIFTWLWRDKHEWNLASRHIPKQTIPCAAILPNGKFNVVSASQEAVLMVVCFIYAKSKNAKQV